MKIENNALRGHIDHPGSADYTLDIDVAWRGLQERLGFLGIVGTLLINNERFFRQQRHAILAEEKGTWLLASLRQQSDEVASVHARKALPSGNAQESFA
jgi:hypothetical protein